jgi:hypothetical protein
VQDARLVLAAFFLFGCGARDHNTPDASNSNDLAASGGDDLGLGAGGDLAMARADLAGVSWWHPGTDPLPWQWLLSHEISLANASDSGANDKDYTGAAAQSPLVFDIDGFTNTAADVAALHSAGKKVICYIEVGALENYRPDASMFPPATLGNGVPNYASEKYLNINDATVLANIEARIQMCAQKGFDAIEPDIDDSYTDDTGFTISEQDNVAYLTRLSDYAHSLGLAWGLKNGGDGGNPAQFVPDVLPIVDFAVVEEPFFLKTIGTFYPTFYNANKAMFVAEYTNDTSSASTFCPQALSDHVNAALFSVDLDGSTRTPCQ